MPPLFRGGRPEQVYGAALAAASEHADADGLIRAAAHTAAAWIFWQAKGSA